MIKKAATARKKQLPKEMEAHKWKPGQSGNPDGRKPGLKNKYTDAFYADILDEWMLGGREAIKEVREKDPATFLRVCASIIPKDVNINDTREIAFDRFIDGLSDSQLDELIAGLCALGSSAKSNASEAEEASGKQPDRIH